MQSALLVWYICLMANDTDWIVFYGISSGYALGPYHDNAGSPYPPSPGGFTDHPQQAIGWATREEAERVVALVGHGDARIVQRGKAIASWRKGVGRGMDSADWGTLR